ncbi:MAG: NifU family protein [Bacilli bacterium]|jgi:Fe-S cluster biogenesis protein NfuA|nr:NifU family protein [Bacilli bacterium]HHU24956.1 NifU family protein [Acholeplasmataceae bacterium]
MDTEKLIINTINKLRPYLQRDGGDVEYVKFENGIVYVRLVGACVGCSYVDVTLSDGIEAILLEEVPGVIGVEQVE